MTAAGTPVDQVYDGLGYALAVSADAPDIAARSPASST
jgi:hypothetical protein